MIAGVHVGEDPSKRGPGLLPWGYCRGVGQMLAFECMHVCACWRAGGSPGWLGYVWSIPMDGMWVAGYPCIYRCWFGTCCVGDMHVRDGCLSGIRGTHSGLYTCTWLWLWGFRGGWLFLSTACLPGHVHVRRYHWQPARLCPGIPRTCSHTGIGLRTAKVGTGLSVSKRSEENTMVIQTPLYYILYLNNGHRARALELPFQNLRAFTTNLLHVLKEHSLEDKTKA